MSENRRAGERGRWTSQLRRVALVAVIAIAASALLPLAHASTGHAGECGVCSVFAHGGANLADRAPAVALPHVTSGTEVALVERVPALPRRDVTLRLARAPPLASVSV